MTSRDKLTKRICACPPLHSLVEGVATVGIAIICIFILPDTPQRARLLSPQEKDRLIYRLQMDRGQKDNTDEISAFKGFKMAVSDPKTWLLCGILTSTWVAFALVVILQNADLVP
jgi:hypothetical protein